jgi:molybdate transport system ATP-binding protein
LRAWRPAAQERYHSIAGRDAPALRAWLAERFMAWKESAQGDWRTAVEASRLEEALALCGLGGLADRPVSLLSNGESARACLAAALGARPALLVLEDLTEGLDAEGRHTLVRTAETLAGRGAAVLVLASRESLLPWAQLSGPPVLVHTAPAGKEVFACAGLNLEAGDKVLVRDLSWTLREGERWWLRGPNGAGKSSLLAYLSGEHPQAWAQSWSLKGRERGAWTPLDVLRREVAWVSPELAAVAGRSVADSLEKALDGPASLMILDEPLRGLDARSLDASEARMTRALLARPGLCVVFVSHDPLELPAWINRSLSLPGDGSRLLS